MLRMECPTCHAPLEIPDAFAGKKGKCKYCTATIVAPLAKYAVGEQAQPSGVTPSQPPTLAPEALQRLLTMDIVPSAPTSSVKTASGVMMRVKRTHLATAWTVLGGGGLFLTGLGLFLVYRTYSVPDAQTPAPPEALARSTGAGAIYVAVCFVLAAACFVLLPFALHRIRSAR